MWTMAQETDEILDVRGDQNHCLDLVIIEGFFKSANNIIGVVSWQRHALSKLSCYIKTTKV